MPLYATRYPLPDGSNAITSCYAANRAHLDALMKQRGMGETFVGDDRILDSPRMPSGLLRDCRPAAAMHALIWISMIAVRSGQDMAWRALNDRGVVHALAHELEAAERLCHPASRHRAVWMHIADQVEAFEREVPGVHPCWGGAEKPARPLEELVAYEQRLAMAIMDTELKRMTERLSVFTERSKDLSVFMGMDFAKGGVLTPKDAVIPFGQGQEAIAMGQRHGAMGAKKSGKSPKAPAGAVTVTVSGAESLQAAMKASRSDLLNWRSTRLFGCR